MKKIIGAFIIVLLALYVNSCFVALDKASNEIKTYFRDERID